MEIFDADVITAALADEAFREAARVAIKNGFVAYSAGDVTVPPVGHLDLPDAGGECHIKYGWIRGDDVYLVKIASGFYGNAALGLPSGNGMMVLFSARTGAPAAILLDAGLLTDVRTAMAGAIAAAALAPPTVECIGIVGGGIQARLQLRELASVTACRRVLVSTRSSAAFDTLAADLSDTDFTLERADSIEGLFDAARLIVTTTPATKPFVRAQWVRAGTHITCMGSDGGGKQELDAGVFARADVCIVDSLSQCLAFGDTSYAVTEGALGRDAPVELGAVLGGRHPGRTSAEQITIADLTGVAVQDIAIAKAMWARLQG